MVQSVSLKFRVFCSPTAQDSVYFKAKWDKKKKKKQDVLNIMKHNPDTCCVWVVFMCKFEPSVPLEHAGKFMNPVSFLTFEKDKFS